MSEAHGAAAIAGMFAQAKAEGRAAFLPYYPIGYPTFAESLDAIAAMAEAGADGFEIGVPFSDPLADGPVIQSATQVALENGTTVAACLDAVRQLRDRGVTQPFLMMGYINPILAYGEADYVAAAKAAGVDGLIVPDLPLEESAALHALCDAAGLALVQFVAPTTGSARVSAIAGQATGFIYVVSLTGVTGARSALPDDLTSFVTRLRQQAGALPLVMGFGISTPEQARLVSTLVDGFIVGSALVRAGKNGVQAVGELCASLASAIRTRQEPAGTG